ARATPCARGSCRTSSLSTTTTGCRSRRSGRPRRCASASSTPCGAARSSRYQSWRTEGLDRIMHTLLFLAPGHFHAALTLRVPQARAADEVFVYAREGAELRDFLALVERFNRRSPHPTRWRPVVTTSDDPLERLAAERRGDVVILAGRNGGKARTMRRLHESGFHVLADKPWLVQPGDLEHVRASLEGWPLAAEIMTGRHDVAAGLVKRLVGDPTLFGAFRDDGAAIVQESVHHLEKLVDGAALRRPGWFFDVR